MLYQPVLSSIYLREGLTFKPTSKGRERVNHADIRGKGVPGQRSSKCKGPEVGTCLLHSENSYRRSVWLEWGGSRDGKRRSGSNKRPDHAGSYEPFYPE